LDSSQNIIARKLIDDIVLEYTGSVLRAKRLVARSRDTVEIQPLWETKLKYRWHQSSVYLPDGKVHNGWVLLNTHTDVAEGERIVQQPMAGYDTVWHILVGDRVVNTGQAFRNNKYLLIAPPDGRTLPVKIPNPCIDQRVEEDEAWRLDWGWQVGCQSGPSYEGPFGENIVDFGSLSA
jgi:hypothetical protein